MICVYDVGNENFDKNGDAVLMPLSGTVKQVAGGNYTLDLEHPIDPYGKWEHLVPEAVIRAPVPEETITTAFTGMSVDVYVTTAAAALRSGPHAPQTITYTAWSITANYSVGSKVTFSNRNWQCTYWDDDDAIHKHLAPSGSTWWTEIARNIPGDPLLVNLKPGAELYYVSGPTDGWYVMSTPYGLEGYIQSSYVEYSRHLDPEDTKPRHITTQLFRIKKVTVETKQNRVTVNADHVSYDLNGVLIDSIKLTRKGPAETLAWIQSAFMIDYRGTIATDMTSSGDTKYTNEISGKSGMFALVDPDKGVVATFDAAFRRDNWDLFVMEKTNPDKGFRVRYGGNMMGINWSRDDSQVITRIVPVAKDENGDDFYLTPDKWVDSTYLSDYPVIRMERLKVNGQVGKDDGSETATNWTESTLRTEMARQAQSRFDVDKCDVTKEEITIDFEMLGETAEHGWMKGLQEVLLYDTVTAIDERIGLSVQVTVSELEYDVIRDKITALKLTNITQYNVKNVGGFNVLNNSISSQKLTDDAGDEMIDEAVDTAVAEAEAYTKSYTQSYTTQRLNTYDTELKLWLQQHYQPL